MAILIPALSSCVSRMTGGERRLAQRKMPGVGHMPGKGEDEQEAARVFYVAATRATQRLVIGVGGDGGFGSKLGT
jgi:superfamily I DNA/RNA helicase